MMAVPCFAPLLLMGSLLTLHPNPSHTTSLDGVLVEGQTCETGVGLDLKVSSSGVGSVAVQYGLGWTEEAWSLTVSPKVGVGVLDQHVPELTSQVNFSLGAQIIGGYQRVRLALEYWHQSNAFLGSTNAGLDMITIMGGWAF